MNNNLYYKTRCDVINDVIASVAEEQSGLARILEVEAEKIKTIIANSKSNSEILEANKSVQGMINSITKLEFILSGKIELFKDCLCVGCTEKEQGYSLVTMVIDEETGGRIVREETMSDFSYYHGTTGATIKMIAEPDATIYLKSALPTNWKYEKNILYIPSDVDWTRSYYITFTVGDNDSSYDINFTTYV